MVPHHIERSVCNELRWRSRSEGRNSQVSGSPHSKRERHIQHDIFDNRDAKHCARERCFKNPQIQHDPGYHWNARDSDCDGKNQRERAACRSGAHERGDWNSSIPNQPDTRNERDQKPCHCYNKYGPRFSRLEPCATLDSCEEHQQSETKLSQHAHRFVDRWTLKEPGAHGRCHSTKTRRPQAEPSDDFANHARLAKPNREGSGGVNGYAKASKRQE
jgi:hypothetical protein